ncbi:uncharacterized protein Bfra_011958 [Botrytis fragariae]|uniref:Uncharacterized protein n=1 Tax=Botrytis fragariae TaxID=1964551 RepID=A0A8H6AJW6_9HELO|nr:uncharacterized protein Bfra_011958 [Botrytis fragariae]KAF5868991.1 hypothetical protein Bfra_011958 [Botrytis fragariae]
MASNGTPRKPRKKATPLSFSTTNIGTSLSQGSAVASLTSPSQLVLGYSAGQLIRTPPVTSSFNIEDRKSPRSPTPRSTIASKIASSQPRARVNQTYHALGNKADLAHFANSHSHPHSPFTNAESSLGDLSNRATAHAGEIPVAKMASLHVGDGDALAANLMGDASTLPAINMASVASAPQLIPNSNTIDLGGDKIHNLSHNDSNRETNSASFDKTPVTSAQEPFLTTNSEFPTNTDANKQQWKAAVKANNPPRNPFHLSLPNQAHRRTASQGSQGTPSNNNRSGIALSNAYTQMVESVEKANGTQGNANIQATAMMTGRNPFSRPSAVAALDVAPNFEANFKEMMETLGNAKPGDFLCGMDLSGRFAQASSVGAVMRRGFEDGAKEGLRMQLVDCSAKQEIVMSTGSQAGRTLSSVQVTTPDRSSKLQMRSPFQTSMQMQPTNHPTAQETMMNTGNQAGGISSVAQITTPDRSSTFQLRSPFQTSMRPVTHSTTQQNITNNGNLFEGTSLSTGQKILTDSSLGSNFPNTTQMHQSSGQGDTMNNGGYDSGVQDDNAPSSDIIGDFAREYGSANHNAWLTADMNESSIQGNPAASIIGASPSTHANTRVDMVGSTTQALLPNTAGHPMDGITFTGSNNGNLSSVSGGYNMNLGPNTSSQVMSGALASGLGPDTNNYEQSSPRQVIRQSSATPVHGHTPNNSMESRFSHMGSQVLNSPNHPVQSTLKLRRSATPIQSAIKYPNEGSPAAVNSIARSTRSSSATLTAPEVSLDETSPNPSHPASFHQDTPCMPDTPLFTTRNPLHPSSFHQPTPRAQWPTSRVPIPPNPAVSGNTLGYFEPSPMFNSQINANSNTNLMNLNRDMLMQFNPTFQQHQYMLNQRGQNNLQLPQQFHQPMQSDQFEARMNQAAMENEANGNGNQANIQGYTPPVSPPVSILNTLFRHRASRLENFQPLTEESIEPLRLYQVAAGINTSLQAYNLNSPMPFDRKPPPRLPNYLIPDRRSKIIDLDDRPLALNKLTVGESFECDFCTGTPNLGRINRYNHDFVEIWGPAGRDWCAECKQAGKHILAAALTEKNDHNKKGKRPAKDPAGPGPTPKRQAHASSASSTKMTRSATAATASYDRYAPLSEESNVFGDPLEILSPIDNMLINPFMHNLTCRGSAYRQIDLYKTKICLACKVRKMEIVNHGCHDEFTHIVALNMDGQWQVGCGRGLSGAGLRDGEGGLGAVDGSFGDFGFDVGRDLSVGNMTVEEINSIVNVGLSAGGVQASSGGMNPSVMQPTSTHTDNINSRRNSIVDSRANPLMSTSIDFDIDSDLHCDMNSILNSSMDSMFGNDDFSWGTSGWLSTHTSTSNSAILLPTPTLTTPSITFPSPRDETHDHQIHMNRLPHRPISKSCMICPAPSVFLCDGCPLTLCEKCRYRLRDAKGWLNNLIYSNGVNHNRNDAFLLRSDDGGYYDYGKFWPVPAHVNGKGVFGDGGR